MAGRPLYRSMISSIADNGGLDYVLQRISDGDTMRLIAADLGCTRSMLSDWIYMDVERRAAYLHARATSAAAHAEKALEIADNASETGTSKARLQVEARQWLAGVYDREQFAQQKPGVQINIGHLHLDALRQVQAIDTDTTTLEIESSH